MGQLHAGAALSVSLVQGFQRRREVLGCMTNALDLLIRDMTDNAVFWLHGKQCGAVSAAMSGMGPCLIQEGLQLVPLQLI